MKILIVLGLQIIFSCMASADGGRELFYMQGRVNTPKWIELSKKHRMLTFGVHGEYLDFEVLLKAEGVEFKDDSILFYSRASNKLKVVNTLDELNKIKEILLLEDVIIEKFIGKKKKSEESVP